MQNFIKGNFPIKEAFKETKILLLLPLSKANCIIYGFHEQTRGHNFELPSMTQNAQRLQIRLLNEGLTGSLPKLHTLP